MKQPEGFEVKGKEYIVCKLNRSLYGLKQSSRCWNEALNSQLKKMHFKQLENDPCIYTLTSGGEIFIAAVYVDDIILASKSSTHIQEFIKSISESFDIKGMGKLRYFLGVKIAYPGSGKIWIGQPAYTAEVLKRFQMENSKPTATPIDNGAKLTKATEDSKLFNQELYQSAIGSLLYLSTRTRPDIAYAVSNVARFCSKHTMEHWKSIKHIMRYLNGTRNYGFLYDKEKVMDFIGYSDADWAGDLDDRMSTSGYVFKLSGAAVSWRSKKQSCVSLSTAEAEYMALASAAQEAVWMQRLQNDLNEASVKSTLIYEDNQSTLCMAKNPQYHGRAKYIDIKFYYIREQVEKKAIQLEYCESKNMVADMLTKALLSSQFVKLREMLRVRKIVEQV